jgi:hypothetical protein
MESPIIIPLLVELINQLLIDNNIKKEDFEEAVKVINGQYPIISVNEKL